MRKLFALIAVLALLLPVLAGCRSTQSAATPGNTAGTPQPAQTTPAPPVTDPTQGTPVDSAADPVAQTTAPEATETKLTRDEAINIALKDAGLTREEIQDLDAELDRDYGTVHYDVDFEQNDRDYDYEIDANTGKILKKEVPKELDSKPASTNEASSKTNASAKETSSTTKQLTREKARDIALKHAGLTASQVRDLDVELDRDDGTLHYDVDFEADGYDYEYEIHATSGKILRSQKERD